MWRRRISRSSRASSISPAISHWWWSATKMASSDLTCASGNARNKSIISLNSMAARPIPPDPFTPARLRMVEDQLRRRGIGDDRVLTAFARVPRHEFVAPDLWREAYEDRPLCIGEGQTISQPYMHASMLAAAQIQPTDVILEVGTGSGYQTALL